MLSRQLLKRTKNGKADALVMNLKADKDGMLSPFDDL